MTLSEKIFWIETCKRKGGKRHYKDKKDFVGSADYKNQSRIKTKDVKEFIKELKEDFEIDCLWSKNDRQEIFKRIDKLAGEDLIK